MWGGPPDGNDPPTVAAKKIAFAPRGKLALGSVIGRDLWEIGFKKTPPPPKATPQKTTPKAGLLIGGLLVLVGGAIVIVRRRRSALHR